MSAHAQTQAHGHDHGPAHGDGHYIRIWAILLGLLIVSVVGPMAGIRWLTLDTAFGIAFVKAYMVIKNFMHIDVEKPIVHYIMITGIALMVLMYGALAPDIQKAEGQNWKKDAGFHHSFTTSKPHHAGGEPAQGEHSEAKPAEGSGH